MNNKILLMVLFALVFIFVLARILGGDKERTFDPEITNIDTSGITKVVITPRADLSVPITLERDISGWTVSNGDARYEAPAGNVAQLLSALSHIEAQRVVASSSDKWAQFEVDGTGGSVQVFTGKEKVADLAIGAFKFDQAKRSASTYIRKGGGDEVYIVEGFLAMQLGQGMAAYRNSLVLNARVEDINRIEMLEGDSREVLTKDLDGQWYYAGMEAVDSARMAGYINRLGNVTSREFADSPDALSSVPSAQLIVSGNHMEPVEIQVYSLQDSLKPFLIHSSLNKESYFTSDSAGIYQTLFGKLDVILDEL